jgi:hypothetical protein
VTGVVRSVTWRSVTLGLAGVVTICLLTPYNDYAVNNTYFVGNFLPVGLLLIVLAVVLGPNALVSRLAPRLALSAGELAVAVGMMLVSCTLPSSGLMRYLPASLVGLQVQATQNADYASVLNQAQLPSWLFPTLEQSPAIDPVVTEWTGRAPPEQSRPLGLGAVPWRAWVTPALGWAALLSCLYGAVVCLSLIVRRQWAENERLAFPLATVYLSLIEPPEPGRALNRTFRSPAFWTAFAAVFALHGMNAVHEYAPQLVPQIPLKFDNNGFFADPPLNRADWGFKSSAVFFSVVGLAYFLQGGVAFSLWFFFVLNQLVRVLSPTDITDGMKNDQAFGAIVVYAVATVWIGRQHWAVVIRQMFRGHREGEPVGGYLPFRALGWLLVACVGGVYAWLLAAGMSVLGGAAAVVMLLTLLMTISRVVAETGLMFVQLPQVMPRPWAYAAMLPTPAYDSPRSSLLMAWTNYLFAHDLRESAGGYALTATRVADQAAYDGRPHWKRGWAFVACLALALVVGYVASGAGMLWVEYNHAVTLDNTGGIPNAYGNISVPIETLNAARAVMPPQRGPSEVHNPVWQLLIGSGLMAALATLRLAVNWWPLHPVGYLLVYTYPMQNIWFSLFLGWLAKVLVVKYGGSRLLQAGRPFFIGLILGEATAAAFWLIVSLGVAAAGMEYVRIGLLPG